MCCECVLVLTNRKYRHSGEVSAYSYPVGTGRHACCALEDYDPTHKHQIEFGPQSDCSFT